MSRGNVFKLSGNMALNSNNPYPNQDVSQIKNSLKLLKSKQNQRRQNQDVVDSNYPYTGNSYNSNPRSQQLNRGSQNSNYNNNNKKNDNYKYDLDSLSKNHIPNSYKDLGQDKYMYQDNPTKDRNNRVQSNGNMYDNPQNYYSKNQQQNNYQQKNINKNNLQSNYNYQKPPIYKSQRQEVIKNKPILSNIDSYKQSQKTIKQVNRQNKVDIVQYNPRDFIQCSEGCGRKFNPQSLAKHQNICKTVFQKKRKQYNAQAHRIVQKQQVKLMKKGAIIDQKLQEKKTKQKMAKWKAQSLAFRAIIKQGKSGPLTEEDKRIIQQSKDIAQQGQVKCPYCGRTFNETAGPRHITFCQGQQKKIVNKKKK